MDVATYANELVEYMTFAESSAPERCNYARDAADKWYPEAHEFAWELAERYGISIERAAGIIAAMSIRQHWNRNKKNAELYLAWYNGAVESPRCLGICIHKCNAIMFHGDSEAEIVKILNGQKIVPFFLCILHPLTCSDAVVDSWMIRIWKKFRGNVQPTRKEKGLMKRAIEYVAQKLGWSVPRLQAYVWTLIRGKAY